MADHEPDVRSSGTVHMRHRALAYGSGFATDREDEYVYVVIPQVTSQLVPIPSSLDETGFPISAMLKWTGWLQTLCFDREERNDKN